MLNLDEVIKDTKIAQLSEDVCYEADMRFFQSVDDFIDLCAQASQEIYTIESQMLRSPEMEGAFIGGMMFIVGGLLLPNFLPTVLKIIKFTHELIQRICNMIKNSFIWIKTKLLRPFLKFRRNNETGASRRLRVLWADRGQQYVVFKRPKAAKTLKELQKLDQKNMLTAEQFKKMLDDLELILKSDRVTKGEIKEIQEFRAKIPQMLKESDRFRTEGTSPPSDDSRGIETIENMDLSQGPSPEEYIEFGENITSGNYENDLKKVEKSYLESGNKLKQFEQNIAVDLQNATDKQSIDREAANEIYGAIKDMQKASMYLGRELKDAFMAKAAWAHNFAQVMKMADKKVG